jgi:hypothetical protein
MDSAIASVEPHYLSDDGRAAPLQFSGEGRVLDLPVTAQALAGRAVHDSRPPVHPRRAAAPPARDHHRTAVSLTGHQRRHDAVHPRSSAVAFITMWGRYPNPVAAIPLDVTGTRT